MLYLSSTWCPGLFLVPDYEQRTLQDECGETACATDHIFVLGALELEQVLPKVVSEEEGRSEGQDEMGRESD